jgi:hypothetical protein
MGIVLEQPVFVRPLAHDEAARPHTQTGSGPNYAKPSEYGQWPKSSGVFSVVVEWGLNS